MSEPRPAPTVGQIVLGRRLQELRETAGLTLDQASKALRVNPATVRRMERAEVGLKLLYVEKLLQTYGIAGRELEDFLKLAEEANKPGWWQPFRDVLPEWFSIYVSLEGAARLIRGYEPHFVPGLLQTEDYARAVLRVGFPTSTPKELERRIALRMERQELLRAPGGTRLWMVLEEAVLRRPVGGRSVMHAQLERLIEATHQPNVTIQIVPTAGDPHPGMFGPFQLFRFQIPELPDVVYTESLTGSQYLDERADVVAYLEALDRMCAQAAPASQTEDILGAVRKGI